MERKTEFVLIANEKGGTAKTATVLLLANCLTAMGFRVAAIDMDPSGNLSASALPAPPKFVLYDIFNGSCYSADAVVKTDICDIIPTQKAILDKSKSARSFGRDNPKLKSLGSWFDSMISVKGNHEVLWCLLRDKDYDADFYSNYDFVLIDSSPSDNLPITNCIMAADSVIVPCEPVANAINGLDMFRDTLKLVNDAYANPQKYSKKPATIDGVLISRCSEDSSTRREMLSLIREYTGNADIPCYNTAIRISPSIETSMNEVRPLLDYMYRGNGATDAINFTLEFLAKRDLSPRKKIPGIFTDETGKLIFRKNGDPFYIVSDCEGEKQVTKKSFRTEYLDDPQWVAEIGKTYFFHPVTTG